MTNYPYILFNKSPEQLRRVGARGGKAQARNRRLRLLAQAPVRQQTAIAADPGTETPAQQWRRWMRSFRGCVERRSERLPDVRNDGSHPWLLCPSLSAAKSCARFKIAY